MLVLITHTFALDVEGQTDVARVFRDTAEGETGHANGHLFFLEAVGDPVTGMPIGNSSDNLASAIAGETHVSATLHSSHTVDHSTRILAHSHRTHTSTRVRTRTHMHTRTLLSLTTLLTTGIHRHVPRLLQNCQR